MLAVMLTAVEGGGKIYAYIDDDEYTRALETIVSGKAYTIYTEVEGAKYYLTKEGELTSTKASAGVFILTKTTGGAAYTNGIRIATSDGYRFAHPSTDEITKVNENKKLYRRNDKYDRNDYERQVFRMDENGNYAIRTTNVVATSSSWGGVADMYWTVYMDDNTPYAGYTQTYTTVSGANKYDPDYRWHLDTTPLVTSPLQLSNSKVYTIRTTRGYMTLNTAGTQIVSSHKSNGGTVNSNAATDDASKQFGILNIDGKYFIYSPKVNKFAEFSGWELGLYTDRGTALYFTEDGSGNPDDSNLRIFAYGMGSEGGNKFCLNNNNSGSIVLKNYTTAEAGNTLSIEEVGGVTLDTEAALAVWNGTPDYFDPHKVYYITNSRITRWTANEAGTGLTGTSTYSGASDAYQQFVFIKYDGKPCLYNVGTKKFVAKDGTLTSSKSDAATISVWHAGDANYPYCFFIEERGLLFNAQSSGGFDISTDNGTHDAGNKHGLTEVADVDDYEFVTYILKYNNIEYAREYEMKSVGAVVSDMPSSLKRSYIDYSLEPLTVTAGGANEINVTTTLASSSNLNLFPDYASIDTWKNLKLSGNVYLRAVSGSGDKNVKNAAEAYRAADDYQWAFVGNPYQVKVYNKATGSAKTLARVDGFAYLTSDTYVWDMMENTAYAGAVTLRDPNSNNDACINEQSTKLAMWESSSNYVDEGSALLVEDVPTEMMGSEGLLTSGSQLTSNSIQSNQFTTANLLRPESDGYGKDQFIWHSKWTSPNAADTYTYLQAELDEARTDFYFTMLSSEWDSTYDTPNEVVISGSDDGSTWTEVTHLTDMIEEVTHPTRYTSPRIHSQAAYRYWQFEVRANTSGRKDKNGNPFVSLGRFQMYPPVPVEPYDPADYINLVFIGNSITAGAGLTAATEAPPVRCGEYVETATGKAVGVYNGGNGGKTTVDFLPEGSLLPGVISNAGTLGTNGGKMYFSIMLGTNDSAESGTTGAPVSTSTYQTNMERIIEDIIAAFPESKIIVNYPIWYSDNTHNGATYEAAGQERLHSYYPIIDAIAGEYSQVYAGDRNTWELFEGRTNLFQEETYSNGPFYLHPNATGADFLGQIWAKSLLGLMEADGISTDQTAVPICWREGLTGGNFGTICLPYSVAEGNLKGATFYKIASKTNGSVNLEEVTSLTAGHAYLYEVEEGKTALQVYGNAGTTVEEPVEASASGTGLTGAFVRTAIPLGKYMLKNNTLYYVDIADYAYVGANKAYIDASAISDGEAGVKSLSFFEGDDPTAISTASAPEAESVYTLDGIRLQGIPKHPGVYVVGGRKVIIK